MDGKRIQCLSNASQHVAIYLQPFTSYSEILVENCNFFLPLAFGDTCTQWRREFDETKSLFAHDNLISRIYTVVIIVDANLQTVKLTGSLRAIWLVIDRWQRNNVADLNVQNVLPVQPAPRSMQAYKKLNKSAWTQRIPPQRCKVDVYTHVHTDVRTEPCDTKSCFA